MPQLEMYKFVGFHQKKPSEQGHQKMLPELKEDTAFHMEGWVDLRQEDTWLRQEEEVGTGHMEEAQVAPMELEHQVGDSYQGEHCQWDHQLHTAGTDMRPCPD